MTLADHFLLTKTGQMFMLILVGLLDAFDTIVSECTTAHLMIAEVDGAAMALLPLLREVLGQMEFNGILPWPSYLKRILLEHQENRERSKAH